MSSRPVQEVDVSETDASSMCGNEMDKAYLTIQVDVMAITAAVRVKYSDKLEIGIT